MSIAPMSQRSTGAIRPPDWQPVKRVIDGKAYNTETSSLLHEHLEDDEASPRHTFGMEEHPYAEQMYRTRLGKFFLVVRNVSYMNPAIDGVDLQDLVYPLDVELATKWMEKHCNSKLLEYVDVPDAGEPSSTLTLRIDKILKIRLNTAAIQENISMNAWCARALESAIEAHNQKDHHG
jgi:hypothetical protein